MATTPLQQMHDIRRRLRRAWLKDSARIKNRIAVSGFNYRKGKREHIGWYDWRPATKETLLRMLVDLGYGPYEDMSFELWATHENVHHDNSLPHQDVTGLIDRINLGD